MFDEQRQPVQELRDLAGALDGMLMRDSASQCRRAADWIEANEPARAETMVETAQAIERGRDDAALCSNDT